MELSQPTGQLESGPRVRNAADGGFGLQGTFAQMSRSFGCSTAAVPPRQPPSRLRTHRGHRLRSKSEDSHKSLKCWRARREDLTASRNPCFYCITGTPAALSDTTKVSHRQPISSHIGADEGKLRARPINVEMIGFSARYDLSFVALLCSARQLSKGLHTRLCLAPKQMCLLDDLVGAG